MNIKKQRAQKVCHKRKRKFENYKNRLEATQLENKINFRENKVDRDSIKENYKEFIRNNESILKIQQTCKSERHNVFIEEINNIALSSNDDKRIQSIDSIETYVYGTRKYLVSDKDEIKCNNIKKLYKK